ncbi:LOW QUALITY PROTEIN: protein phosphatase 2C-like domain-containing protein 1 [Acridotheres tristis]
MNLHYPPRNHSTSNIEKTLQNGGNISTNKRLVEGYLRTTRALGYHKPPVKRTFCIPIPHIASVPLNVTCSFLFWLLMGFEGFWCTRLLANHELKKRHSQLRDTATPCSPCEQLAKTALATASRDHITILIILLNGCDKIPNYLNI